jgi:hypothetical protein
MSRRSLHRSLGVGLRFFAKQGAVLNECDDQHAIFAGSLAALRNVSHAHDGDVNRVRVPMSAR